MLTWVCGSIAASAMGSAEVWAEAALVGREGASQDAVANRAVGVGDVAADSSVAAPAILDAMKLTCDQAWAWGDGTTRVLLARGGIRLTLDQATAQADEVVIWITPREDGLFELEAALLGGVRVERDGVERSGDRLRLTATVRPQLSVEARTLDRRAMNDDASYARAVALRDADAIAVRPGTTSTSGSVSTSGATVGTASSATVGTTSSTTANDASVPAARSGGSALVPVRFRAGSASTERAEDGTLALVLEGEVFLTQTRENGDHVELRADRAVLFSNMTDLRELLQQGRSGVRDIESAYLEGAVLVNYTPAARDRTEQRLRAGRVLYDFRSERAVLSDAILQTTDPETKLPLVVRGREVRRLGEDAYDASGAVVSTSSFATPSLSLRASRVYVSQKPSEDAQERDRTNFRADNVTLNAYGVPFFWLPRVSGSVTDQGIPLRNLAFSNSRGFGFGVESEWALFDMFGFNAPRGLDATLSADYYSTRGPAAGVDASYQGNYVDADGRLPWSFSGDLSTYLAYDDGEDRLGGDRRRIENDGRMRGRAEWQHQHFTPGGWQLQARAGYTSDATFLEEWYEQQFNNGLNQELALYAKKQTDIEALTLLVSYDANDLATSADQLQEVVIVEGERRTMQVERLPEIGYHRIGNTLGESLVTWNSNNVVSGLRASISRSDLDGDLGFRRGSRLLNPGLPGYGFSGADESYVARGDFRQEVSLPLGLGPMKLVPYIVGRYTAWSDTPDGSGTDRLYAAAGVRLATAMWRVYPGVNSRLLDLRGLRHVIEPELHLYSSAQTTDRDEVFVYDEPIDGIQDVHSVQLNVRQRFQTKRGDAGRQRSVDVLTLNAGVAFFANTPDEADPLDVESPDSTRGFRGVWFASAPEAGIPRNGAFLEANWSVSDTTAVLGDVSYNLAEGTLATAAAGVAVARDPRVRYYVGARYIGEINSTIGSFRADYQMSPKYSVNLGLAFSLSDSESRDLNVAIVRRFDQYALTVGFYYDDVERESGLRFGFSPMGMGVLNVGDARSGAR